MDWEICFNCVCINCRVLCCFRCPEEKCANFAKRKCIDIDLNETDLINKLKEVL